jgi:transcriptional regulator with XRE-family HTH domain
MKLKEPLREIRLARGFSLIELGRRVGISRAGVSQIERRGRTKPSTALRLAEALEVPPYILFPGMFTEAACRLSGATSWKTRPVRRSRKPDDLA